MGYNTSYSLEIQDLKGKKVSPRRFSYVPTETEEYMSHIPDLFSEGFTEGKWYDHVEDMLALSVRYPDYFFILTGEGEESGDLWRAVFHQGKHSLVRAEIVYPKIQLSGKEF